MDGYGSPFISRCSRLLKRVEPCRVCAALLVFWFGLVVTPAYAGKNARAEHVIFVVWDGVRPDVLQQAYTPHLDRLAQTGSYTWNAWTTWRPSTLTAIPSMHTGASPEVHGVSNWEGAIHAETLAEVFEEAGRVSAVVGVDAIHGGYRATHVTGRYFHYAQANHFAERAIAWFEQYRPGYMYLYNARPDTAGHRHGSWSDEYREAIEEADRALGRLLEALDESGARAQTLIVVTTDHGMTGHSHGYGFETDMRIFSVWNGPGVRAGHEMADTVRIPAMAAGSVTVRVHRVTESVWDPDEVTWATQPAPGTRVSQTHVDREGWFAWDVTALVVESLEKDSSAGRGRVEFMLIPDGDGDGPSSPGTDGPNPALYSKRNKAVFLNSAAWSYRGVHPHLRIIYDRVDGDRSVIRLTPRGDVLLLEGEPDTNYRGRGHYYVGHFTSGESRVLVRFDVETVIPEGATLRSASFRAHCWRVYPAGYPATRVAHRIIDIAPTISRLMGVRAPKHAEGRVIEDLLAE